MNKRIEKKIVGYKVTTQEQAKEAAAGVAAKEAESNIIQMHEKVSRPEALAGSTYKIKTPMSDHALYLTINDIVLNEGTDHELRRPFEVFINSKNMDHFQWIVGLTRVMSAVFRKGGDLTFLVEELHSVFDPNGGYYKKGGKYVPSLVAEIGEVVEQHLIDIGMLKKALPDEHQKNLTHTPIIYPFLGVFILPRSHPLWYPPSQRTNLNSFESAAHCYRFRRCRLS